MKTLKRSVLYTFEDFCDLIREDQKADLIDGVIYMASPDKTDANEIFVWLIGLMNLFARRFDLGKVYGSRVAFQLGDRNGPEPDIAFVQKARLHLVKRGYVEGPADLAVEIVSPDSIERDYEDKRLQYEGAGFKEYWIVDEIEETVTLLRLNKQGKFREVRARKGEFHSEVLPGFWLKPQWLWQRPLPDTLDTFNEILARLDPPDS